MNFIVRVEHVEHVEGGIPHRPLFYWKLELDTGNISTLATFILSAPAQNKITVRMKSCCASAVLCLTVGTGILHTICAFAGVCLSAMRQSLEDDTMTERKSHGTHLRARRPARRRGFAFYLPHTHVRRLLAHSARDGAGMFSTCGALGTTRPTGRCGLTGDWPLPMRVDR